MTAPVEFACLASTALPAEARATACRAKSGEEGEHYGLNNQPHDEGVPPSSNLEQTA